MTHIQEAVPDQRRTASRGLATQGAPRSHEHLDPRLRTTVKEFAVISIPLLIVLGFAVGVGLGFTGVGAGSLLTPILVLFGVHPVTAVGTSLVFAAITKTAGSLQHLRQKTADLGVVRWMAVGSVPSALISLILVRTIVPRGALLDVFTQRAITGALVLVAIVLTLRFLNRLPVRKTPAPPAALIALGALVGAMVALTSVGSGSIAVASLGLLTPMAVASLVGTDMTHAALLSFVTAPFYIAAGAVNYEVALGLAIGSIPGVILGSRLTTWVPERVMRGAVLVVVWAVALRLV